MHKTEIEINQKAASSKNKQVNIAQIGVGYWGPNLLRNLVANPDCAVTHVVDLSQKRRDYVRSLYPAIEVGENVDAVLGDDRIDAVIIATPVRTHFELVSRALEAGQHVLVEKPMATSVEEIDRIEEIALRKQLVAMVGHTFLFNPAVRYLRKLIDSGGLGDIRYIYSQRLNLGRIRSDVDALWNLAPHDVSIIQYLLGDPKPLSVRRSGMAFIQDGIDDVVFLNVEYPGKIMAHIHVSWLDPHKVRKMTVVGSKKMAIYDDIAENKIAVYDKGIEPVARLGESMDYDAGPLAFNHRSGDVLLPRIHWQEPLQVEISHFFACVAGEEQCITGPAHARQVVNILAAGETEQ
jgi:predicted dehydrogenase